MGCQELIATYTAPSKENLHNLLVFLLKLSCITGLMVQTTVNMMNELWDRQTYVTIHDAKISELDTFPLVFKLILYPGYSHESLKTEGYNDTDAYFFGYSRYNGSVFGWSGHNPDGSVRDSCQEVFDRVKYSRNVSRFLKYVQIWTDDEEILLTGGDIDTEVTAPYYPNNAIVINISGVASKKNVNLIGFAVNNLTEFNIEKMELVLLDKNLVTVRPMSSLSLFLDGQIILEPGITVWWYNL